MYQKKFTLKTVLEPKGDQPKAIAELVSGVKSGSRAQVLLGITGSGKTFTMANVVAQVQKPTLVLAHNKTLAAQLYQEFKTFFPENAVEYFVSYYDYYQPEAYVPRTDTYIEKDMAINDAIEKMRLSATRSLLERQDVLIVASVSCIYGLGSPEYYRGMNLELQVGKNYRREDLLLHLVEMQYKRNEMEFTRTQFRVRGDVIDIFPAYEEEVAIRLEFFDEELENILEIHPLTGRVLRKRETVTIYPGSHHVTPEEVRWKAVESIREELQERVKFFEQEGRLIEKQRIEQRTKYDLEMIREMGTCKGIENYSRHFSQRKEGEPPPCLIDYFPKDFLFIIDESHQTLPQLHAMANGDRARKQSLVDFGFRLPSAYDNRPLRFEETYRHFHQMVYVSATPGPWEIGEAQGKIVQQVIRPTGLLDPIIEIKPAKTQVDDCLDQIHREVAKGGRVLVTTLTKKLAEELTSYLEDLGIKTKYLHSDIDTIERVEILKQLRLKIFDVLVGINLLREGLDLPEVSFVAILDADREGFLRSETALIQTCGRAARHAEGRVIMYADKITTAIQNTVRITTERRLLQKAYNEKYHITPTSVIREIEGLVREEKIDSTIETSPAPHNLLEVQQKIEESRKEMYLAAKELRFEDAAKWRDTLQHYEKLAIGL